MLKVGDQAPDFPVGAVTLYQMLSDRLVAVYFFPRAFTPGCTLESRGFGAAYDELRAAGCDIVGVSTNAQRANDSFKEHLCLPFALVGDADESISRAYGVRIPIIGIARRVTYLIGRDRRVKLAIESNFAIERHLDALRAALPQASQETAQG